MLSKPVLSVDASFNSLVPGVHPVPSQQPARGDDELRSLHSLHKASEPWYHPRTPGTAVFPPRIGKSGRDRERYLWDPADGVVRASGKTQTLSSAILLKQHRQSPDLTCVPTRRSKKHARSAVTDHREDPNGTAALWNATLRDSMASDPRKPSPAMTQRKRKQGGWRSAIRRILGRKSAVSEDVVQDPSWRRRSVSLNRPFFPA